MPPRHPEHFFNGLLDCARTMQEQQDQPPEEGLAEPDGSRLTSLGASLLGAFALSGSFVVDRWFTADPDAPC